MNDFPPFCGGDARKVSFGKARAAVLPVPYEGSVSYGGGTSQGPRAIAAASEHLEMYDEELDWCIDEAGIFTLPPVQTAGLTPEQVMAAVHEAALAPLKEGKLLCTLGGEHSISYGVFTALREARSRPFSILQIDAHADLRQSYQGNIHSHACIMARAHDLGIPFVQVGIRSLSAAEMEFLRGQGLESNVFWARRIAEAGPSRDWMDEVVSCLTGEVYISVDVDALDPGIMPATGTPEPGGLEWYTLLALLRRVAARRRVVALDLMEFAPIAGLHAPDFLAARLVYKMIGYALHGAKELE